MNAQLETAGSQISRVIEKYEKNIKSAKRNSKIQSYFLVIVIVLFNIVQVTSLANLAATPITGANIHMVSFAFSLTLVLFYAFVFSYMFMFKLATNSSFMEGKPFKLLGTMPLGRKDLEKIGIFAFLRLNLFEYIAIVFTFPIIGSVMTGSIAFFFTNLVSNALYVLFSSYLLVIASNFISKRIMKAGKNSRVNTLFKILFFSGYIFFIMFYSIGMQYMVVFIGDLYQLDIANVELVNALLSLVFFPFSASYLSAVVLLPPSLVTATQVLLPLAGIGLLLLVIYAISRKAGKVMRDLVLAGDVSLPEKQRVIELEEIEVKVDTPMKALVKKTLLNMTREIGNIIYYFMSIALPLVGYMAVSASGSGVESNPIPVLFTWFIYLGFIPFFIHFGLSGSEEKVGGLYSALPIRQWDVYKTRRNLMLLNQMIALGVMLTLYGSLVPYPLDGLLFISLIFPIVLVLFPLFLILASALMGNLNKRYTLMVVVFSNKFAKQLLIGFVMYAIIICQVILIFFLWTNTVFYLTIALVYGINIGIFCMLEVIARKMFKGKK